ncbi:MAG TPA: hypothetical protein VHL31_00100 [Geminicoccus sp.]|uniref:hypothetical protein n=1 Tax=Geminicoccus sp. TaxID=2024832 RepID=UPI002E35F025|nr:hypothetical protein [Geminicoccus sp.]HEX2524694.1 hypothetical protein [Geminicoccus sp.]
MPVSYLPASTGPARARRAATISLVLAASALAGLIPAGTGGQPSLVQPPAEERANMPIRFRMGTQGTLARIVLESEAPFTATEDQDGGDLVFRFGRELHGDARRLPVVLGEVVLSATARGDTLRLRLRQGVFVEPRQSGPGRMTLEFRHAASTPDAEEPDDAAPLPALLTEDPVDLPTGTLRQTPERAAAALTARAQGSALPLEAGIGKALAQTSPVLSAQPVQARLQVAATAETGQGVAIDYRWNDRVPAAAFMRDDQLWIVFAAQAERINSDPVDLTRTLEGRVLEARREARDTSLVFRLRLAAGVHAAFMSRPSPGGGSIWRLVLAGPNDVEPTPTGGSTAPPEEGRGTLRFPGVRTALWLSDAVTGDRLLVLPRDPGLFAPYAGKSYPDVEILPSLAGVVIQPWRPESTAELDGTTMLVRRSDRRPLALAREEGAEALETAPAALDFVRLGAIPALQARRAAAAGLAAAPDDIDRRAELVRALLAARLVAEALTVLDRDDRERPQLAVLAAVADALEDPGKVAMERFAPASPADAEETALWRAHLLASRGDLRGSIEAFERSGNVLERYPAPLRAVLAPSVVGAQIEHGSADAALAVLDRLLGNAVDPQEIALLELLQGRALASEEAHVAARRKLLRAAAQGDRDVAMAARGDGIDLDLRSGVMAAGSTNAELAAMAPSWEGRRQEGALEQRRARVALQASDWRAALSAADRAARLPTGATEREPVTAVGVLAQALAAPDLSAFGKLQLLQDRQLGLLRDPALAAPIALLARDLARAGAPRTADSLLRAAGASDPAQESVPPLSSPDPPATDSPEGDMARLLTAIAEDPVRAIAEEHAQLESFLDSLAGPQAKPAAP